ncbi:MAG: sigma-70 family RNA polymerase sigma factor [Vicinamibacterales bacterium]
MRFETTQWSVVLAAGAEDTAVSRRALETLCETYWYPLYAYVRRRGHDAEAARDLTQGFFAAFLARRGFDAVHPDRGRFRAFLLASMKHYLSHEAARRHALKRGSGIPPLSLGIDDAEGRYRHEPAEPVTPEHLFERRWALTVIDRILDDLRGRWAAEDRADEFDALKACLLGDAPPGGYEAVAARLGSTPGAVKVAVHRLRRRFHTALRARIAETVLDPAEVDDEVRYLIDVLGR